MLKTEEQDKKLGFQITSTKFPARTTDAVQSGGQTKSKIQIPKS
jgi:hypothetical protein